MRRFGFVTLSKFYKIRENIRLGDGRKNHENLIYINTAFPLIPIVMLMDISLDLEISDFFKRLYVTFKNRRSKLFKEYKDLFRVFERTRTGRYLNSVDYFRTIVRESGLDRNYKTLFLKDTFVKYGSELEELKLQLEYMQSGDKRNLNKTVILESEKIIRENIANLFDQMVSDFRNFEQEIANKVKMKQTIYLMNLVNR